MWYVLLLAACVAGDQLLKWWVTAHLEMGDRKSTRLNSSHIL